MITLNSLNTDKPKKSFDRFRENQKAVKTENAVFEDFGKPTKSVSTIINKAMKRQSFRDAWECETGR